MSEDREPAPPDPSEGQETSAPIRKPPAPPTGGTQPLIDTTPPHDSSEPTPNDWLDPTSHRHHRRQRTAPTGPIDRLRRKWRRWRRHRRRLARTAHWYRPRNIALGVLVLVLLTVISVALTAYLKIDGIRRAPLLPLTAPPASVGTNILLLASDGQPGALTLDANTLEVEFIHLGANFQSGQVIDLPRDLVISSPAGAVNTVGSLYRTEGVAGLVDTLQKTMGLTIDHAVQTSFTGYAQVSNDLGTLEVQTESGKQPFTASQARSWLAQPNLTGGSIESGSRLQHWSKAMLQATLQPSVLLNPVTVWSIFSHTANNVVVDETLDNSGLIRLVWHLRSLRPAALHFYTAPNSGYGQALGQRVLLASPVAFSQLSTAIRTDNLATLGLFQ